MRDADRITLLLAAIERRWRETPDLRLGQLLMNQLRGSGRIEPEAGGRALFNLEDGELLRLLGPATEDEQRYVDQEPDKRRGGWGAGPGSVPADPGESHST